MDELNKDKDDELGSLEASTTVIEPTRTHAQDGQASSAAPPSGPTISRQPAAAPASSQGPLRHLAGRFNIYLLLFILLIILAGVIATIFYLKAQTQTSSNNSLSSQSLSQGTLDQLANNDVSVGGPKHTLSVESNAVFTGNVLIRSNLQIAGTLQVGSDLAINGIRVTGNSTFDDVQITKSLALSGDGSIQGQLNVQKSLDVNGGGTFLGAVAAPSITVGSLQLSGDLNLTHHIAAGGSTPGRSNGTALGGGGTVSVSGSDTAGSVTINTGGSPGPGCFLTINFVAKFNSTPHILVTPVGSAAAGLAFYINRSTSSFSICTTSSAPAGTTFGFDYIAFD